MRLSRSSLRIGLLGDCASTRRPHQQSRHENPPAAFKLRDHPDRLVAARHAQRVHANFIYALLVIAIVLFLVRLIGGRTAV
jgi:hypothetical protein